MNFISVEEACNEIGFYAKNKIPFLFVFDFEMKKSLLITNPLKQKHILFHTPLGGNVKPKKDNKHIHICAKPLNYKLYESKFNIVRDGLMRGDSFLTNLTVKTPIECTASLEDIYNVSQAPYCLCIPNMFVCFSPERFVLIENKTISTNPMKGTINADVENAEEKILNDAKETAEHTTVVDLLRNDIGINAKHIRVSRFRYIDKIKTQQRNILQVSSEIKGDLNDNWKESLGKILFNMLPAGSVSGAPKKATLKIIKQAEGCDRGFYCGVFGYFDGNKMDSAVLIRFIEQENGKLFFRSGGGITVNSDCKSEYNEVIDKIYIHKQ